MNANLKDKADNIVLFCSCQQIWNEQCNICRLPYGKEMNGNKEKEKKHLKKRKTKSLSTVAWFSEMLTVM